MTTESACRATLRAPWTGEWIGRGLVRRDGALQTTVSCPPRISPPVVTRWNAALRVLGSQWTLFFEHRRNDADQAERFLTFVWQPPREPIGLCRLWNLRNSRYRAPHERIDFVFAAVRRFLEQVEIDACDADYLDQHAFASKWRDVEGSFAAPVLHPPQFFRDGIGDRNDTLVLTCALRGFPSRTDPGMLEHLAFAGIPYRWVSRFTPLSDAAAGRCLARARAVESRCNPDSSCLLSMTISDLSRAAVGFGELTTALVLSDRDADTLRTQAFVVCDAWRARGFDLRIETCNALDAWRSSLPGELVADRRRPIVSTHNLAHILSGS